MEESNVNESLKCAGCLNDIGEDEYISALAQDWHKDCFRCSVCDASLSTWYFEKAGLLFCQNDYWARYGDNCQQCAQVITGPVMAAGEHRFHPECFACAACGSHVEDGEPYALLERSHLYCGACCGNAMRGPRDAHAIHVLRLPGRALRLAPTTGSGPGAALTIAHGRCASKLSALARALLRAAVSVCIQLTCHRIDSSCGVLTLHIGDRVLEINGAPLRGRTITDFDPDAVVQLTIEHNPDTLNMKRPSTTNTQTDRHVDCDDRPKLEGKSPIERKIHKEDLKKHIPNRHSIDAQRTIHREDEGAKKERLFKRKGEDGGKRVIKRRQIPSSPLLGDKERSSSMSKLLDVSVDGPEASGVLCDLSRARSFRAEPAQGQKVFRASDLLQGELLGSGFFGQVYKVTHRDTNEVMVLKQLYRVDEDAQRNFLKEVAVLRSLQHPNVLRFVGVLYKDKRLHLVTEYVAGGTLHQLLQDSSRALSWGERARLARDVAAGLGYLHRMNVIHRDLNSHNCLVREDQTVIVADFGLARIVQRTASSSLPRAHHAHASLRRKRYTVVGNPYWMAPEMMNGNVYDEKVDVFSFGIILCEIIGRVSADPDFLPRRSDFGLNEALFVDKFCKPNDCPEPFYRVAFLACQLDPDTRPPFEVMEIWLESLVLHLTSPGPLPPTLLADIEQYARGARQGALPGRGHATPESCPHNDAGIFCTNSDSCPACLSCHSCRHTSPSGTPTGEFAEGVMKSQSNASVCVSECGVGVAGGGGGGVGGGGRALGKCVSAGQLARAAVARREARSRSHHALAPALTHAPGYILSASGRHINITKVDDINEWLDPPQPLKRTSPDYQLNNILSEHPKTRKVEESVDSLDGNLPSFLRNQSVEGLESKFKHDVDTPLPFCRHYSIPDNCESVDTNSDSSDDDLTDISDWYRNISYKKVEDDTKNILAGIVKKGESILAKKASYDVTDTPKNTDYSKIKIEDVKNNEKNSNRQESNVRNIPKTLDVQKSVEKPNFFAKKLLSPKLSRLFKNNSGEVVRKNSASDKEEKSRSNFFVQKPSSPGIVRSSYRVRPADDERKTNVNDVIKSDLKLASLGKPMTPIFRRHLATEKPDFVDCRYSCRDRKRTTKNDEKFIEIGRNRIKTPINVVEKNLNPLINTHVNSLAPVQEKQICEKGKTDKEVPKKRELGISRSNYVSLANLKINNKQELGQIAKEKAKSALNGSPPVEKVI
ncbi:PREDICTED: LIM domain kinase 1 isoform X1 [Papilio xuthus]|uniref:LIM domain kinase 1 n=1 Tax=Papilio xuthus TaxID=66420 RepID=A0AAJ6Z9K1_PAPXU|nr:PREDICTED: LIM domain kinase 1 isoform X1 [Papilio xuthus]